MINVYQVDSVTLVRPTRDQWGEITGLTLTPLKARIDYKVRKVIDFKGEEVLSSKMVLLQNMDIHPDDRLRIDNTDWPIKRIEKPQDFSWHIVKVFL